MERREHSAYATSVLIGNMLLMIPGIVAFASIKVFWETGGLGLGLSIAGFLGCLLVMALRERWLERNFRCPECDSIAPSKQTDDGKLFFQCNSCEIEWHTGMGNGSD